MTDWLTPLEQEAIWLSLKVALLSLVISLPPGVGIAYALARGRFPGRQLLNALVHAPLVLPPVVAGYGLLLLFGRRGLIGAWLDSVFGVSIAFTWQGAAIAAAVMAFPLLVRAIWLSLDAIDRRIEAAARTLGAGPLRVFFGVTLPLAAPGIVTGSVLAFARSLGEFGATITFVGNIPGETRTLPIALYSLTQIPGGEEPALRLMAISTALAFGALIVAEVLNRRLVRRAAGD
jgi:molybdate transport system permease protein